MSLGLNQVIKLTSNEGGPITPSMNRVSFSIPANSGSYDLSRSYILLNCSIESDQTGIQIPQVMLNNDAGGAEIAKSFNIGIIKNARMQCKAGPIADIKRIDLLRNTLNNYTLTTDEQQSLDYLSLCASYGQNQQLGSIFREIYKEGAVASKNKEGVVKIHLDQIFNFGKNKNYSTEKFGRTDINLELNLDKISVSNYLGAASTSNWSRQGRNGCQTLTATLGADSKKLFTTRNFINLEDSPYWVGQKIVVAYTDAGATGKTATKTITAIDFLKTEAVAGTSGQITLTLDSALEASALTGGQTISAITCTGVDANFTFVMQNADLVLDQLPEGTPADDEIVYSEFTSEVHTSAASNNFQKQFFVEPEAINLYVMNGGTIVSKAGDLSSWRLRLDNKDLTNRVVDYHSPLSLDRIGMSFNNSQLPFHNANEIFSDTPINQVGHSSFPASFQSANKLSLICNPLPLTESQKMVQLNLNSGSADISEIVLYKELVSKISV